MSRDTAGRGGYGLRLMDVGDLIAPGTAVALKTDHGKGQRFIVAEVYLRITDAATAAVVYTLAETAADIAGRPRVRVFEAAAALVELADPPPVEVANELTATTPGGRIKWEQPYPGMSIHDTAGRFVLYYSDNGLLTPTFFATDKTQRGHSPTGILCEVKSWCEARLSETPPPAADPVPTATVAGVDGVEQTVPLADAPGW